jgi:serine phosphatase RsbU (regulator of sigma subunit)
MQPPTAPAVRSHHTHLWQVVVVLPLLTIVPVLVMSWWAVSDARAAIRQQVLQPNRSVAQTVAAAIGRYVQTEQNRVAMVADDPGVIAAARRRATPALWDELAQAQRHSQELQAWTIVDIQGRVLANFPRDPARIGKDVSSRGWFRTMRDQGWSRPYVSSIYQKLSPAAVSRLGGGQEKPVWVVALAMPVRDAQGPVGVVLANLTLHEIGAAVAPVQGSSAPPSPAGHPGRLVDGTHAYGYVVDQRGHLVYYPGVNPDLFSVQNDRDLTAIPPELDYSNVSIVRDLLAGRAVPDGMEVTDDRRAPEPQLAWAASIPTIHWHVIVQQPRAAAMAPVENLAERLRSGSAVVVVLAFLVAAGAAFLERRIFTLERRLLQSHHEYQLAYERAERDADMAIGQEIQKSLLRQEPVRGIDIECHSDPAQLVGGDFYSVFPVDARRQGILIGDVSGKGVKAALYMTVATTLLQTLARREPSPARVLEIANTELVETMHRLKMFVTALYGVLDLETNRFTFANAGHLPPIRRRGGDTEEIELYGIPLGALPDASYEEETVHLQPGEALVFYSDGYVEARGPGNEMIGFDGLRAVLERSRAGSAAGLIEDLLNAWKAQLAGREQEDDLTLVVLRRAVAPAPHEPGAGSLVQAGRN